MRELTNEEVDTIARLALNDIESTNIADLVTLAAQAKLIEGGFDPSKFKREHLLMTLVVIRTSKYTGRRTARKDDIVAIYNRAVELSQ